MKFSLITRAGRTACGALLAIFLIMPAGLSQAGDERLKRDALGNPVGGAVTDDANQDIVMLRADPVTKLLKFILTGGVEPSPPATAVRPKVGDFTSPQTNAVLWTPAAGKRIVLVLVVVSVNVSNDITLTGSSDGLPIMATLFLTAKGGATPPSGGGAVIFFGNVDETIRITSSGGGSHSISLHGYEI